MLSTCRPPLATASPAMANFSSSSCPQGSASSAFAATTAPTAEAAEPPRPEPSGMPLSISRVKPNLGCRASCMASSALPAVLSSTLCGSSPAIPLTADIVTPGAAVAVTVTRSPSASTANPRMSKPIATLPTEAGANALARMRDGRGRRRHQALDPHVLELELESHFAPEDDELACHVLSREIVARIGLGETAGARLPHDLREARRAVVHVEEIRGRTREDAVDAPDLVAGLAPIAQPGYHGKPRAPRGLVEVMRSTGAPRLVQPLVVGEIRAVRLLVRRHDVNAGREPLGVAGGDRGARGAVDEHRVRQVIDAHVLDEARQVGRRVALLAGGAPAPESQPRLREQHAPRGEHAAHAQIELALPSQPLALRGELIEQHTAHRAGPDHADRDGVRREIQSRMHGAQRPGGTLALDHRRDVALGGALGDGAHVDAGGAEGGEYIAGDAGDDRHAVDDHGEDGDVSVDLDARDLPLGELVLEGAAHHAGCALGLLLRDRAADRVLGAPLRDEDDGDALLAQRPEQAVGGTRHSDHARTFQVDERDALDTGDPLDGQP